MTCPGCNSHTSSVLDAVRNGQPCPYCGLSADAINAVNEVQASRATQEVIDKYTKAEIRASVAEAKVRRLSRLLGRIKSVIGDFEAEVDE